MLGDVHMSEAQRVGAVLVPGGLVGVDESRSLLGVWGVVIGLRGESGCGMEGWRGDG